MFYAVQTLPYQMSLFLALSSAGNPNDWFSSIFVDWTNWNPSWNAHYSNSSYG